MPVIQRSYGKIGEQNKMLGFHMVNPEGKEFFIYADPLINTYINRSKKLNSGKFVRIKKRDSDPKKNRGYHQGEIWARAVRVLTPKSEIKSYIKIHLYFGPVAQRLTPNPEGTGMKGHVSEEVYKFPEDELIHFVKAIEAMYMQNTSYILMKMGAEVFLERDIKLL